MVNNSKCVSLSDASGRPKIFSFISKCQLFNSFPSGVAPKSLRLADLCLPPVIQCSVLDGLQELVHIIPQHAASKPARVRSQVVVAMRTAKQQENWDAATRFLRRLNIWEWEDEALLWWWYVSLFLTNCRFYLDVFLRWIFDFSLLVSHNLPSVYFTGKKRKRHLHVHAWVFLFTAQLLKMEASGWRALQTEETVSNNTWFSLPPACNITVIPSLLLYNTVYFSSGSCHAAANNCDFTSCTLFSLSSMCAPRGVQEESASIILSSGELLSSQQSDDTVFPWLCRDKITSFKYDFQCNKMWFQPELLKRVVVLIYLSLLLKMSAHNLVSCHNSMSSQEIQKLLHSIQSIMSPSVVATCLATF